MANKAQVEFNMAAEIRLLLRKNPQLTGREVEAALRKKFPRRKINSKSCGVAFSNARRTLRLIASRDYTGELGLLWAAKHYVVVHCDGDFGRAFAGFKQLVDLQVKRGDKRNRGMTE